MASTVYEREMRLHSNKRPFEYAPLLSVRLYKTASLRINSGKIFVDFPEEFAIVLLQRVCLLYSVVWGF